MGKKPECILRLLDERGVQLCSVLMQLVPRQQIAEELMQDLFLNLYERFRKSKELGQIEDLESYAYICAANLACDWLRKYEKRPFSDAKVNLGQILVDCGMPFDQLVREENLKEVNKVIGQLRGDVHEAFVLYYIQQESSERIAEKMGKSVRQTHALCARGMAEIWRRLAGKDLDFSRK